MITIFTSLPYPLIVALMIFPILLLIWNIKNIKREGKLHLPFVICCAILGIVGIIFVSATKFAEGSQFEEIMAYILLAWVAAFFIIGGITGYMRYKRGQIPEKRLQIAKSFIIPIIVLLIGAVFSFIMAAIKK